MNNAIASILLRHGVDPDGFRAVVGVGSVLNGVVPGAEALSVWQGLRAAYAESGWWPVIRGGATDPFEGDEGDDLLDTAATLAAVPVGPFRELLRDRVFEQRDALAEFVDGIDDPTLSLEQLAMLVDRSGVNGPGDEDEPYVPELWPHSPIQPAIDLYSIRERSGRPPHPSVRMTLVRAAHPYDVPAHIGFGGWNDCPAPELQVAALREWGDRYGAVPACVTRDVMECVVDRPPRTEEQAFALAAEQWIFCDDIVSQGTRTVRRLAKEVWRSPRWFFWWD